MIKWYKTKKIFYFNQKLELKKPFETIKINYKSFQLIIFK